MTRRPDPTPEPKAHDPFIRMPDGSLEWPDQEELEAAADIYDDLRAERHPATSIAE